MPESTATMLPPSAQTDAFGPDSPCDLDNCPIEWSIYQYRPDLAANIAFLALFAAVGFIHIFLGIRWKSWGFMVGMILGCVSEVAGYAGRILLYYNPFSFNGFMIQIGKLQSLFFFFSCFWFLFFSVEEQGDQLTKSST